MYGGVPDISQTPVSYQGYGDNIFLDVSHCHSLHVVRSASLVNTCLLVLSVKQMGACEAWTDAEY